MQNQGFESPILENDRVRSDVSALKRSLLNHLFYLRGKLPEQATLHDCYLATAYTVRDRLLPRWRATQATYDQQAIKQVGYFSSEFLASSYLSHYLINLGLQEPMREALQDLGLDLDLVLHQERCGLGCRELRQSDTYHLDSLATLRSPAIGYGIRYELDIFNQDIYPKQLLDISDKRLHCYDNPWEISRPEWTVSVPFGGFTQAETDEQGSYRVRWVAAKRVQGVPYDVPIPGYQTNTVNTLRLWSATVVETFESIVMQSPEQQHAAYQAISLENLIRFLSPWSQSLVDENQQLHLQQQYFFVSCALQDVIRIHCADRGQPITTLSESFALQLNKPYHAIAIPELMRLLTDDHYLDWDTAWSITQSIFSYTHYPFLLEEPNQWSVHLFSQLLPRHLELIYEINQRFLTQVRVQYPDDEEQVQRMSLIDETDERHLRGLHLAYVGSHPVNGVIEPPANYLKPKYIQDFYQFFPDKFSSKVDGALSPRFIVASNLPLSKLITQHLGDNWIRHAESLSRLEALVGDPEFCQTWQAIKQLAKQRLANYIWEHYQIKVDPYSLFDIHAKPIVESERQHLTALYILTLYNRIKANPSFDLPPRTFVFSGRAIPTSDTAKWIMKLIYAIACVINQDPEVQERIKVVFLKPNTVQTQYLYASADLSEHIALANISVRNIANMKFALNGALTIGTLNEANLDLYRKVGSDNFFLFGLTTEEINILKASDYNPWNFYYNNRELQGAINQIASGYFADGDAERFKPLVDTIMGEDNYLLLADYPFYVDCQDQIGLVYRDRQQWTRKSILNVARMSQFSSDWLMNDYQQAIWKVQPVSISVTEA
ncbi:MAG: glycogen/starch/alpha-glucan phosphorylase [Elainellaceae cyanobacterium]